MKTPLRALIFSLFALMVIPQMMNAQKVFVIELADEIHAASARHVSKGFDEANAIGADLVLIHMDTYGGQVDFADSIRQRVLNSKIPTAVFVDKNAASAGALISIACDSIYMAPGSSIGAATVVIGGTGEAAPDKYQSYMRSIMRATAETKGRRPDIAEKMVDQNLDLPGISDEGQVITFTPQEAKKYGYCNQIFDNLDEVLAHYGYEDAEVITYEPDTVEVIISFLVHPAVSGVLMMMIFGGIFFELKTPGVGFPGAAALIGLLLFFAPHYLEGLVGVLEIVMFVAGVGLIALEIFVVPGFGITGISGILLTCGGLALGLVRNDGFDFTFVPGGQILQSFAIAMTAMATSVVAVIWIAKQFVTETRKFPFVDFKTQDKEDGYTAVKKEVMDYVGQEGEALTDLRPTGVIEIGGKRLDAETEGGYVDKGTRVKVLKMRSTVLLVRELEQ